MPEAPERRLRRFVWGAMTSPFTLPMIGGSLLAAVAFGVHLGESAVSMINPIYYQGPAIHPRDRGAAIDESQLTPSRGPVYAELYGWREGDAARAADCGDCGMATVGRARAYSAVVPYFGGREARRPQRNWSEDRAAPEVVHTSDSGFARPDEDFDRRSNDVLRYASSPLRYEDAAFPAPAEDESGPSGKDEGAK